MPFKTFSFKKKVLIEKSKIIECNENKVAKRSIYLEKLIKAIKKREGFRDTFYITDKKKTIGYGFQYKNRDVKEKQPISYYDSILVNKYLKSFEIKLCDKWNNTISDSVKYKLLFVAYVSGKIYGNKSNWLEEFNKRKLFIYYK